MRHGLTIGMVALAAALTTGAPTAFAASKSMSSGQDQGIESNTPSSDCHARPEQAPSDQGDRTGSITRKLDKCGGVLNPPDVNDPGLVKPAPDTGAMPVIKPGQVPEQAPKAK